VETSMDVEFSVDLKKKSNLTGPRVETPDYVISVGAQPEFVSSLDRALQFATTDMVRWLVDSYGLEPWAAHLLIGAVGKYDVVTVQGTMALKVPKRYIRSGP
jgi:amidase